MKPHPIRKAGPAATVRAVLSGLAGALALFGALAFQNAAAAMPEEEAGRFTLWYPDDTQLTVDRDRAASDAAWRDRIGGAVFDTRGIGAYREENRWVLLLDTRFPDRNVPSAGRPVSPADLALDLDNDGQFETAVILSDIRATGDRGIERPQSVRQGDVYRVERWYRPDDLLQHTYGQGWRWAGRGDVVLAQAAVPVWMAEGEPHDAVTATVDWLPHPSDGGWLVRVELQFHQPLIAPPGFAVVWGTAVCGNDVMFARLVSDDDLVATSADWPVFEPAPATAEAGTAERLPRWNVPFSQVFPLNTDPRVPGGGLTPPGPWDDLPGGGDGGGIGGGNGGGGHGGGGGSGGGGNGGGGGSGGNGGGSGGNGGGDPPIVVSEPQSWAFFGMAMVVVGWLSRRH